MALQSTKDQKRVSAQVVQSSRSAGVAEAGSAAVAAIATIDIKTSDTTADINHRSRVYAMTAPPASAGADPNIPSPKIGDIALVYVVDTDQTENPRALSIYVYTRSVNADGVATGDPSWRMATLS